MNEHQKNSLGVVMCGGQSKRMGSDKGLLLQNEKTWAECSYEKLKQVTLSVVVSVNASQEEKYQKIFSPEKLIIDSCIEGINGPLLGILSVHQKFPHHNLLVLACDMQKMKSEILHHLISNFNNNTIVFKNNGYPEPLCGIYTPKTLQNILAQHKNKTLQKTSMRYILELAKADEMIITEEWQEFFENRNSF